MKIHPLFIYLFLLISYPLSAQQIKGKITDTSGQPISFATLFIRETTSGIVADEEGEFQSSLATGRYTFEFSALGYEKKIIPVEIHSQDQEIKVTLAHKVYSLQEVEVSSKKEDPAYGIMRKVISMAPYYLNQVKEYESDAYVKGTVKVDKLPRLLKLMDRDKEMEKIENKLFLLESQNQITFTAPDQYKQHVIAFSSSIPQDIDTKDALGVLTTSIYAPDAFGRISPMAPGAFSYYKFTLEGITSEGDHLINKIKVTPKKKNPKLVTGWLYIIENSWNVKSADLSATEMGVNIRFTGTYNEIRPGAFLPTAYDIDLKINVAGIKASGKYYSSVQYNRVELNDVQSVVSPAVTQKIEPVIHEVPVTKKQAKARKELEELSEKENLSTREAYKMARLMESAIESEEQKKEKESLEIMSGRSKIEITTDTLAAYRDSIYWSEIRNLPLREEEIISYLIKDSLKQALEEGRRPTRGEQYGTSGNAIFDDIFWGGGFNIGKKFWLGYSGLVGVSPEYNFVDGFWLGQKLTFEYKMKKSRKISLLPSVYYTTARKTVNWQVESYYNYNLLKNGALTVKGGNTTEDFNSRDGHMRTLNSYSSLLFATNPVRFYQKEFIETSHRIDIINGLFLTTTFTHEKRSPLENNTTYSFFGGLPYPNLPEGHVPMQANRSTTLSLDVEYTPRYKYYVWGDRKRYASSKYPTFSFLYQGGIPSGTGPNDSFHRLEAGIKQDIELNSFNRLYYFVNAGSFFGNKQIALPDYKHFATTGIVMTDKSPYTAFMLLDPYRYSTNREWIQGHISYTSQYLLFKNIPFLQHLPFDESIHGKTLWQPGHNFSELGYSIGFEGAVRFGIFTGWEKGKYDSFAVRLTLPFLLEF